MLQGKATRYQTGRKRAAPKLYCTQLESPVGKEYPGNPAARDIRLVFAGKMLSDNSMTLEKLLQNEDLNSWHTFHLIPARTGFSPSVSPADKKLPPDLSPLRGNSPDGEEPEQQQDIKSQESTQPDRIHSGSTTPQRVTGSLNREPTSSPSDNEERHRKRSSTTAPLCKCRGKLGPPQCSSNKCPQKECSNIMYSNSSNG